MINEAIGEMEGWKHFGQRVLEKAKEIAPVGEEVDGYQGPHLKDTLELKIITGSDPRLLIGSRQKGSVLAYVIEGTAAHEIVPNQASVLRFTSGGTVVFTQHVDHPGTTANPFITKAAQAVLGG